MTDGESRIARWVVAAAATLLVVAAIVGIIASANSGDDPKPVAGVTGTTRATTPSTAPVAAAFARHVGLAIAALRTGVQEPYRRGDFDKGGLDVVLVYAKAAAAGVYAFKQLDAARQEAAAKGGAGELAGQVDSLLSHAGNLVQGARSGNVDPAELTALLNDLDQLGATAKAAGIDVPSTSPVG